MERIPKNVRQIGGREERLKVYMEDYVSTYLRKLQEERGENAAAGMLVGSWQEDEKNGCFFISGAVEMRSARTEGGRLQLPEEAWTESYESLGTYFSGQELCGIFVCEGLCQRLRRQALFAAVRDNFPDNEQTLLFVLSEEGEEILYRITRKNEERLQGYFCYFERNEAMQEYMMDNLPKHQVEKEELPGRRKIPQETEPETEKGYRHAERNDIGGRLSGYGGRVRENEGSLGDPAESFRERMRRQQEEKKARKSSRGLFGLCAVMAAVVFASGLLLMQRENGGIQVEDILDRLKINASEILPVSGDIQESEENEEEGSTAAYDGQPVMVEEIPGNVYPTGDEGEGGADGTQTAGGENGENVTETPTEPSTQPPTEAPTEAPAESPTEAPAQAPSQPEETEPVSAGLTYVVEAGDSLSSISRKFYGTDAMVSVIQEMNGLSNADLIKEGQVLNLP